MNQVNLIGNIVRDFEVSYYEKGVFVQFHIAINDYNYKAKESVPSFIEVIAFGGLAETLAKNLKKGNRIAIQGRLNQSTYLNKEEKKISKVKVIAEHFQFLDNRKKEAV